MEQSLEIIQSNTVSGDPTCPEAVPAREVKDNERGNPTRAGVVLTVFGAKGSIGKSTIATNLASLIAARSDLSVLLMDMDTRFVDVALMMDLEPRNTISDLTALEEVDRLALRDSVLQHEFGTCVLAAPRHPSEWALISSERVKAIIELSARQFDYIILDTSGTFNDIVATAIEAADRVIVVTSLDMASIKDTAYMLDLLDAEGYPSDRLLVTVNHVNHVNSVHTDDISQIIQHDVFWEIPYDDRVLQAGQLGRSVVLAKSKARASVELAGLALKIVGPHVLKSEKAKRRNPISRLMRRPMRWRR